MARPYCCVVAEFDGIPEDAHKKVCREPARSPAPAVQEADR
jgi:hypothetical protein